MVMCSIQTNDRMISHFEKRILIWPVSLVNGFSMFICHRDVVATLELRCHVRGVENLLQVMELIINGKW